MSYNTRNYDNTKDLYKFLVRHFAGCSESEILSFNWGESLPQLKKALKKFFSPFLMGEHLYWRNPADGQYLLIGYISPQEEKGRYVIDLLVCPISEPIKGQKQAIERLFELYQLHQASIPQTAAEMLR